jgi:hypothetical protein
MAGGMQCHDAAMSELQRRILEESTMKPIIYADDQRWVARGFGITILLIIALAMALMGCAKHEKVLDVKTPNAQIEVDKTTHPNGAVEIEVKSDRD